MTSSGHEAYAVGEPFPPSPYDAPYPTEVNVIQPSGVPSDATQQYPAHLSSVPPGGPPVASDRPPAATHRPPIASAGAPMGSAGSPAQATLASTNVSAWFGSNKVLERVTLTMEPGKVTALIGPSGCGKSTFLRILNRMHELVPGAALSGSVSLDGVDIYGRTLRVTETRLRIGMVFQRPNPFPSMTIAQNVLAGLRLSGRKTANADALVQECLERAGLWREARNRLNEAGAALSGGQQQRLCIARALAVRPRVLLMDEPCSALDPISTGVIEETIRELSDQVTIVIVTHNMQQAQRVSHNCALFLVDGEGQPGHIVEAGPTRRMFEDPRDPRTADYVHGRFG